MSDIAILLPPFIAGLLMLFIHVPLGREVLRRGVVFIDLSLAQFATIGIVVAQKCGFSFVVVQIFALCFAIFGSMFFRLLEQRHAKMEKDIVKKAERKTNGSEIIIYEPTSTDLVVQNPQSIASEIIHLSVGVSLLKWNEIIIGCSFVLSTTLIFLLLGSSPHGAEDVSNILSGQLLFVDWNKIAFFGSIFTCSAVLAWWKPKELLGRFFYPFLAIIITSSVQVAGVYPVFASLIFPAVGTSYIRDTGKRIVWQHAGATLGLIVGLLSSYYFDIPTGPAVVWWIGAVSCGIFLMAREWRD